jgi:hypothetical protein
LYGKDNIYDDGIMFLKYFSQAAVYTGISEDMPLFCSPDSNGKPLKQEEGLWLLWDQLAALKLGMDSGRDLSSATDPPLLFFILLE